MFTRFGLPPGPTRVLVIWLAILPVGATVKGQVDSNRVIISGKVVDPQQNPLEGVELHAIGDTVRVLTSSAGTFHLSVLKKNAEILIQARRLGYNAVLLKMTGDWNGTVIMMPGAFVLPEIEVTARYAKPAKYANTSKYDDFFRGIGDFITPAAAS